MPRRRRWSRSSRKSLEQSAFGSCRADMLRLFASRMILLNVRRQILQVVAGWGNASLPESAFRSIPIRLTERCATICVIGKGLD